MKCKEFIISILILCTNFYCGCSGYLEVFTESNEDKIMYQKYFEMDKNLKGLVNYGVKMVLPYILQANERLNLTSSCRKEVLYLLTEIRKLKLSALSFLDATGKVPDGFMRGSVNMVGNYDQCLNSSVSRKNGSIAFRGQYCMLHWNLKLPKEKPNEDYRITLENLLQATKNTSEVIQLLLYASSKFHKVPFRFGLCVPSGCSANDIEQTLKIISELVDIDSNVAYCEVKKSAPFLPGRIVAISVFSLFGMLLIIGTFLDYYAINNNTKFKAFPVKLLMCFSVLKNFPNVISAKVTDSSLTCLYGIRVLSTFYIILQHHYMGKLMVFFEAHALHYVDNFGSFFFQIVSNGVMTVDIFFLIGGLTQTYSRLKSKDEKRNISVVKIIIHRLWRLYPALLVSTLLIYIFSDFRGPMRHYLYRYVETCDSNWWKNVLFISNFYKNDDMCVPQAWYVAADVQMFLLSIFIIPVFFRNAKKGIALSVATLCIGICSAVAWAYLNRVGPTFDLYNFDTDEINKFRTVYVATFPHIAPYFTGIILGYILSSMKGLKLPWVLRLTGWPIAIVAFISMTFVTKRWNSGVPYTRAESSLFFAFGRFVYSAAVGWMILCCVKGYGGIINYILSLKIWIPLTKLNYMLYMISPVIQMFYFGNLRLTPDSHVMITIWHYLAEVLLCCLLSLVLVVTIESPLLAMEELLFRRDSPDVIKNTENDIEIHAVDKGKPNFVEKENNMKNGLDTVQVKL